jgi:catechol 2,3-dioxygenase-like lactoylglutathione lyase family enzyme
MIERLSIVPVVVKDLDEAFEFYTEKLGFEKVTDVKGPIHFLTVAPKKGKDTEILLQFPDPNVFGEEMATALRSQIGNNSLIFKVDNCESTVEELRKKGVEILMEPQTEVYGTQAIIADLYGNSFVLREPSK